jgi:hypothetical protein
VSILGGKIVAEPIETHDSAQQNGATQHPELSTLALTGAQLKHLSRIARQIEARAAARECATPISPQGADVR